MNKIRIMIRRILIVLLVIWMIAVFCLSNQNGSDSGNLSRTIANFFAHGDTVKAEVLEPLIRKVAHMTEYAVGAMIFYGITIPIQLVQTIGVVVIAIFNDAFPELAFFLIGFFFTRSFLGETYHLNSTVMCTTFTWVSFFIITALIPSIYISVVLCIILGCLMSAYMHYIVVKEEEKCQKD